MMPDRRNIDLHDLDDVFTSIIIEPDEQFQQRLKARLRQSLDNPAPEQEFSPNGRHSAARHSVPIVQKQHPMDRTQSSAFRARILAVIKTLFVRNDGASL